MTKKLDAPTQTEILQGTLDMLILQTLRPGPAHGHSIAHIIGSRSEDVLLVEHGSLYPALHRLLAATLKRSIREKHPEIVTGFTDFQQRIRDGLARERLMAILCGFFGLLAVFLASVGLYGMISYIVAQRRNEIGVRMALGAGAGQVIAMVLRESAWLVAIGVPIGAGLALAAGRAAGSLLFGLEPYDPATLAAACAAMAAIAGVASFLPARRALKLDPMLALRQE